ncbi:MAG TPA: hypothetical protein DCX53_13435 [Anaerolineae bacterium]|nr:hypothetical protein [Anaerolineae bacterium]
MDAIVLAGGIPNPEDPLYSFLKGDAKALVDVAGKPMIQWVVDALSGAKHVSNIIIVGLSPKNKLKSRKPLHYLSNQGRLLSNIVAGVDKSLELNKKNKYVMVVSSDIPTLKPEMVDWLVDTTMETNDDLYYGVCPKKVMEKRFPGANRTYIHLKDMDICGADINVVHVDMANKKYLDVWESLIVKRKNPVAQAMAMGWLTSFLYLTRQLTLADSVRRVCERINIKGRAIIWSHAEPCMDVDKPHQLELLRKDLAKQQKKTVKTKSVKSKTTKTVKKKTTGSAKVKPSKAAKPKTKPKAKSKKK